MLDELAFATPPLISAAFLAVDVLGVDEDWALPLTTGVATILTELGDGFKLHCHLPPARIQDCPSLALL